MAMTFEFSLNPLGYDASPIRLGQMRVHSFGNRHVYAIDVKGKDGWHVIRGNIPKVMPDGSVRSGHRNFLHLLRDILADVDLASLGTDYVHVLEDVRKSLGSPNFRPADYKEE